MHIQANPVAEVSAGPESGPAVNYEILLELCRSVSSAPSAQAAIERLYDLLHRRCGLLAMTLEMTADTVVRFFPYGDMREIAHVAEGPEDISRTIILLPLTGIHTATGTMTYVLQSPSPVTRELLEALTEQIGLRFQLEEMAQQSSAADERARRRISEVAAIHEIGQAIDAVELPELLRMITRLTARLMDAQSCSILLVDHKEMRFRPVIGYGLPTKSAEPHPQLGEGITGRVAQTGQPLLIVDAGGDPYREGDTLSPEVGSSMVVPMKDQAGKVLGVISICRSRYMLPFTPDDLKLCSVFATQASLAVINTQLYSDLKQQTNELQKLTTLSRSLISTVDLDQLLETVVDEVRNVLTFERCCFYMRDVGRALFTARVWRGYPDSIGRNPIKEGEGAVGRVGRSGELLLFDSRDTAPEGWERDRAYLQYKGFARALGADAFVAASIMNAQGRCIGVLVADNHRQRQPISNEQRDLLVAFINQAGIAIDNSMLYSQMQETLGNIRRLKDYTDRVVQSITVGILSTDSRGVITRWNPAAAVTLNQPSETLQGAHLKNLLLRLKLPEEEGHLLHTLVQQVQETGESIPRRRLTLHPYDAPAKTIDLLISRLPEHNQERSGVVMILEDVTQEARMEAELERMSRLADIGQLAAKMAHEVRNALSPIRGAAQIIRSELVAQYGSTEWPDIIVAEVDHLKRLTNEMLDFARPTLPSLAPIKLGGFLEGAVQLLSIYLADRKVNVEMQTDALLPDLIGDPVLLGQVVRNLVMNAAQAMPDGGTLRIGARLDPIAKEFVLEFDDTGEGIAQADLERIFRPFVTTRVKGTGLGLPIVQKIVDQHGGRIEVKSRIGCGASFRVFLPLEPVCVTCEGEYEQTTLIGPGSGRYPDH